jgi:hypothetical protein
VKFVRSLREREPPGRNLRTKPLRGVGAESLPQGRIQQPCKRRGDAYVKVCVYAGKSLGERSESRAMKGYLGLARSAWIRGGAPEAFGFGARCNINFSSQATSRSKFGHETMTVKFRRYFVFSLVPHNNYNTRNGELGWEFFSLLFTIEFARPSHLAKLQKNIEQSKAPTFFDIVMATELGT